MQHSAKYIIHAEVRTSGVVERSDVVGAVFGQTEGLLGDDLDLRELQDASKVGRIDVDIDSEDGRSFGTFTVGSGMDRVETAVLAASFETIDRVGPCRAECTVTEIEDVRAAKRQAVVDRATELLREFEATTVTGEQLIEEVRKQVRVETITESAGLPAGPNVETSDALIVVEGRADVHRLLEHGIKNAIAVEGTDVPDAAARLTHERTTTAFLDGDRGGDLILEELQQVGSVDYVAFAPRGQSVEDLDRAAIRHALEKKVPFEQVTDGTTPREAFAPTDGGAVADPTDDTPDDTDEDQSLASPGAATTGGPEADGGARAGVADATVPDSGAAPEQDQQAESPADPAETDNEQSDGEPETGESGSEETAESDRERNPETLGGHVDVVVGGDTGRVRLLDETFEMLDERDADEAFDAIEACEAVPDAVVLDGTVSQRVLDVGAQRGVGQIVGADTGEFVKQPAGVRVRSADEFQ